MIYYLLSTRLVKIYNQLKCLISYFKEYRENEFTFAMNSSKKIASKMEIEPIFCEKRVIHRKKKKKKNLMKMFIMRQHDLLKNLLELIISYI